MKTSGGITSDATNSHAGEPDTVSELNLNLKTDGVGKETIEKNQAEYNTSKAVNVQIVRLDLSSSSEEVTTGCYTATNVRKKKKNCRLS